MSPWLSLPSEICATLRGRLAAAHSLAGGLHETRVSSWMKITFTPFHRPERVTRARGPRDLLLGKPLHTYLWQTTHVLLGFELGLHSAVRPPAPAVSSGHATLNVGEPVRCDRFSPSEVGGSACRPSGSC